MFDEVCHWLQYLDFTWDIYLDESIGIMDITNGGFTHSDLLGMDFEIYNKLTDRIKSIQERFKQSDN